MIHVPEIQRPPQELVNALAEIGSATCSGELHHMGIRDPQILGPVPRTPGKSIAGPALTLQFMPIREDQYIDGEYRDPESQLHRHCLYQTQPGDIVVVDARGDMASGVFGNMMLTYFMGRGGAGLIVDGCIRDYPQIKEFGLGLWIKGTTPNYHTQTDIFPFAVNVPIACGGSLVLPGDIIVADDDGVVVVPVAMAEELVKKASIHAEWEEFSRIRLAEGGELRRYYPLADEAQGEYEAWKLEQGA